MKNNLTRIGIIVVAIIAFSFAVQCYINYRLNFALEDISKLRVEITQLRNLTSQIDSAQSSTLNRLGLNRERIDILKEEMNNKKLDTLTFDQAIRLLEKFK